MIGNRLSGFYGWRVLLGCAGIMFLVQSGVQTFSVYMPAIAQATGWPVSSVSLVSTTATVGAFLANLLLAPFVRRKGPRYVLQYGIFFYALQAYLLGISRSLPMLWFAGFLCGGAIAFGTVGPCSIIITNWFVKNRSQFVAVVVAASMFGSTVMNPLAGLCIDQFGWRTSYKIQAIIIGILATLLARLLVVDSPAVRGTTPYGADSAEAASDVQPATTGEARPRPTGTATFWLMVLGIFCIGMSTNIENYLPAFWQSRGISPVASSNIMGVYALIAAVCSIGMSRLHDRLGGKLFVAITSVLFITSTILMISTNLVSSLPLLILICVPFAMGSKKASNLTPTLVTMEAFGREQYSRLIGIFAAMLQFGIAVSNPVIGLLMGAEGQNLYARPFLSMAVVNLLGMGLVITALLRPNKQQQPTSQVAIDVKIET